MFLRGKGLFFLTVMNGLGFYYGFVFGSFRTRERLVSMFLKRVSIEFFYQFYSINFLVGFVRSLIFETRVSFARKSSALNFNRKER